MEAKSSAVDFVVNRSNLAECRFVPAKDPATVELGAGEVLVAVDRFALTANNVTYAVAGDMLNYWSFFPAEAGWGRVPVWGFGDVVRSRHDAVPEGERLYGYYPMSSWLILRLASVTEAAIVDGSTHRQALPPIYNQYSRTGADPFYQRDAEEWQMLFWPLFMTGFLLDDFLGENDLCGAKAVLLTSASSKTAVALAASLAKNRRAPGGVIGLTSKRNVAFVEELGCYDRVVAYDDVRSIDAKTPVAIVDMAGNGTLLADLHRHFGDGVKLSSLVGLTHYDRMDRPDDLPGAKPTFFFAPDQLGRRLKELGPAEYRERTVRAWREFLNAAAGWFRIVQGRGPEALERIYLQTLAGRVSPAEGHILSLRA